MDIQQIKQQNEISGIIGKYISLKRKGNKAVGLCPFHKDHHPSLTVDQVKQTFICLACGARGDVIEFIRRIEKCSFKEALEKLGHRQEVKPLNLNIVKPEKKNESAIPDHTKFLKQLMPYPIGVPELNKVYRKFEVGVSPHLVDKPWYQQRNRLIFPIRDEKGTLRGFSGRSLEQANYGVKYIHTSSKDGFRSSEILYGLYYAKQAIELTGNVFVVEGFKDVLAMHAAGVENCVGLMGTNLSDKQISLLKNYATKVYIVTDGDEPGRKAAQEMIEKLRKEQVKVGQIELPEGEDPDSLFWQEGCEELANRMRFGSVLPHHSEYLLITACLLYPKVSMVTDNPEPFPSITELVLMGEDISMESHLNTHLLECIIAGEIPEEYREVVNSYVKDHGVTISELVDIMGSTEEMLRMILFRFLDDRLRDEVDALCRKLKFTQDMTERGMLLEELNKRKVQQEMVAEELGELGAGLD